MAKYILLPFSFLLSLCFSLSKDSAHSPTKSVWSKVQVQTTWVPPKTEFEPKGTPIRYSWSSISGSNMEILPIKAKKSSRLSLKRDGKNIPLASFRSQKIGWKDQIGDLAFPCGYNMISEPRVPEVEHRIFGAFEIYKACWPNNANGIQQTCFLITVIAGETSMALGFEGDNVSISLQGTDQLALRITGTARPSGRIEEWSQTVVLLQDKGQLSCSANPLKSRLLQ